MEGEDKLGRLLRDLETSIEKAIESFPVVQECMARVRAQGYEASLVLQATVALAPLGQLDDKNIEELTGHSGEQDSRFKMSSHDKKFLRSLKIAVDDDAVETA